MLNKLTSVTKAHWLISPMDAWQSRSSQMIDRFGLTSVLGTKANVADGWLLGSVHSYGWPSSRKRLALIKGGLDV